MDAGKDWDPCDPAVLANPVAVHDRVRREHRVAYSDHLRYSVFRHADVMQVVMDPAVFSSRVSRHPAVPNGMDPPVHTAYRKIVEQYFSARYMAAFAPLCSRISARLVAALPRSEPVEVMSALAHPFAVGAQCAFLGWDEAFQEPLRRWVHKKDLAMLRGDRPAMAAAAAEFDETIRAVLQAHRRRRRHGRDDVTAGLLRDTVNGHPLTESEITSILRNWTVGEVGTIAASVGIIVDYLARHPDLQAHLRRYPWLIRIANDEILRIHPPLLTARRVTTCPVQVGGRHIPKGERVTLMWGAANRDERVFGDPDGFSLNRDPALNLLYGAGIHVCPGAPLARLELDAIVRTLLMEMHALRPATSAPSPPALYPTGGYRQVRVVFDPA